MTNLWVIETDTFLDTLLDPAGRMLVFKLTLLWPALHRNVLFDVPPDVEAIMHSQLFDLLLTLNRRWNHVVRHFSWFNWATRLVLQCLKFCGIQASQALPKWATM